MLIITMNVVFNIFLFMSDNLICHYVHNDFMHAIAPLYLILLLDMKNE